MDQQVTQAQVELDKRLQPHLEQLKAELSKAMICFLFKAAHAMTTDREGVQSLVPPGFKVATTKREDACSLS